MKNKRDFIPILLSPIFFFPSDVALSDDGKHALRFLGQYKQCAVTALRREVAHGGEIDFQYVLSSCSAPRERYVNLYPEGSREQVSLDLSQYEDRVISQLEMTGRLGGEWNVLR